MTKSQGVKVRLLRLGALKSVRCNYFAENIRVDFLWYLSLYLIYRQ